MTDFPAEDFTTERVKVNPDLMAHPDVVALVDEAEHWQAAYITTLGQAARATARSRASRVERDEARRQLGREEVRSERLQTRLAAVWHLVDEAEHTYVSTDDLRKALG